jgi:hypothetical protein
MLLKTHGYKAYRVSTNNSGREIKLEDVKRIPNLEKTWPDEDGIWGTILAIHESKDISKGINLILE